MPATAEKCIGIVSKLKNTKYNNSSLPVFIFKQSIRILAPHIVNLISNSFTTGILLPLSVSYLKDASHQGYGIILNMHSIITVNQFGFQIGSNASNLRTINISVP